MGNPRNRLTAGIWATAAVVLMTAYGVAYLRVVTPMTFVDEGHHGRILSGTVEPTYIESDQLAQRWPGQILRIVFIPAHWVDRKARPFIWDIPSEPMSREVLSWRELTRRRNGAGRRDADDAHTTRLPVTERSSSDGLELLNEPQSAGRLRGAR